MTTILVVEDEGIIAQDIQRTLMTLGYQVPCTAQSAKDALQIVEELQPDLVLMDIKIKGDLDGIEAAALMRNRWDIPVIYLTAHSDDVTLARAKETGPHGYLLKPFNERDLRTAVEVALRKHELEKNLRERERWFSTTLESLGDAVIATNPQSQITFMNELAETLTGWSRADAEGKPLGEVLRLVGERGQPIGSRAGRAVRDSFTAELPPNTRVVGKQRASFEVDDSAAKIVDPAGRLLGGVVVFRDVTERRKMERRLMLSERLASIGTMAAGTAHEINNPLAAVVGNVAFASERVQRWRESAAKLATIGVSAHELREVADALNDANQAAERVRRIVVDLKRFARAGETAKQVLDLPELLDVAVKLTENHVRHNAILRRSYGTTPFVDADEGQLVQVFTNLLINAAQAIGEGKAASNEIRITTLTDDSGRAVVEVRDTGCGIAPSNLGRIFDPFFSTKGVGNGMGLGLSICHGIVAESGGEITVESDLGVGTTFRVALPPASRRSAQPTPANSAARAARRARVLVIDDDEHTGRSVVRVLSDQHDVVTETDAAVALARIARGETFDVIFCDLMMPNLGGIDVHEQLLATRPELARRLVFLTGGAFSQRTEEFLETVANPVVAKPFTVDGLRALVADYVS